jgi:hypothetical protein
MTGVINMGRVLVLFAFTSQMIQQYPTDPWKFWYIYHTVLKGTEYEYFNRSLIHLISKNVILFLENDVIFIGNDVSDWSISFVNAVSDWPVILYFVWSVVYEMDFLIGSFSSILIG